MSNLKNRKRSKAIARTFDFEIEDGGVLVLTGSFMLENPSATILHVICYMPIIELLTDFMKIFNVYSFLNILGRSCYITYSEFTVYKLESCSKKNPQVMNFVHQYSSEIPRHLPYMIIKV